MEAVHITFVNDEYVVLGSMPENQAKYRTFKARVRALHAAYWDTQANIAEHNRQNFLNSHINHIAK